MDLRELYQQRLTQLSAEQKKLLIEKLNSHYPTSQKPTENEEKKSAKKRLIAYCLTQSNDDNLNSQSLQAYMREKLPSYMIPDRFVMLDEFPRLANGKIDNKALASLEIEETDDYGEIVPPGNDTEQTLVEIWSKVLNLKTVSTKANFFEIGGDSILSIQIVSRAREAGLQLSPNDLFEYSTIQKLASKINSDSQADKELNIDRKDEITYSEENPDFPDFPETKLTFSQVNDFIAQYDRKENVKNNSLLYRC